MADAAIPLARASSAALKTHYFIRAGVAAVWVATALTAGVANPLIGVVLLILYPAWDSFANVLDARNSGGLRANPSQAINAALSALAAVALAAASTAGLSGMIAVFGLWAIIAGVLQIVTGMRRWRSHGAQWIMVLSGVQSVLAGAFLVTRSNGAAGLSIAPAAGYAAFGAFYFLVSAVWLTFRKRGGAS